MGVMHSQLFVGRESDPPQLSPRLVGLPARRGLWAVGTAPPPLGSVIPVGPAQGARLPQPSSGCGLFLEQNSKNKNQEKKNPVEPG